jgi:Uri superfamily endonuclease
MKPEPGVYALVMSLAKPQTIKIGKLGTFDFEPGWYIYLGTAHGGGGVKRRTDRHCRVTDNKTFKWNVDYFRPFATMHEIWFSHAHKFFEHEWAWAVHWMAGASIPVLEFGANDCYPNCPAHFFHFSRRPFPAEFRSAMFRKWPGHKPVYTEFVESAESDQVDLADSAPLTLTSYDRGRRYLEAFRRLTYDGVITGAIPDLPESYAKGTPAWHLVEQLAAQLAVTAEQLVEDAKFATAVELPATSHVDQALNPRTGFVER